MKFLYATSIIYPSTLANRIQILSMAEKFQSQLGDGFFLGGKDIKLEEGQYKINNLINFDSKRSYLLAWKYLNFIKEKNINFIYSREEKLLFFMMLFNFLFFRERLNYAYEAHFFPNKINYIFKIVWKNCDKIIVLTSFIKNKLIKAGVPGEKILVVPDGVDLDKFDIDASKKEAREKLKLPLDEKIITYTGSLDYYHSWKGADIFLETAGIFDNIFYF